MHDDDEMDWELIFIFGSMIIGLGCCVWLLWRC